MLNRFEAEGQTAPERGFRQRKMEPAETSPVVRILIVCTGNICRSPVAERLLQAGLDELSPGTFQVRSAGTRAMAGDPVQPLSARIIAAHGGTPAGFAARQLRPEIVHEADLILTMAAVHRTEVVQMDPSVLKRTFTIREFARMVLVLAEREPGPAPGNDLSARWTELPARAAGVRHLALADAPADNDVADPYGLGPEAYRRMEDELAPAVLAILRFARLTAPAAA